MDDSSAPVSDSDSDDSLESLDTAYARVLNITPTGVNESVDISEQGNNQEHVINEVVFQPSDKVQVTAGPVINILDEKGGEGGGIHAVSNYILHLHFCSITRNKMVAAATGLCLVGCVTLAVVLAVLLPSNTSPSPATTVTQSPETTTVSNTLPITTTSTSTATTATITETSTSLAISTSTTSMSTSTLSTTTTTTTKTTTTETSQCTVLLLLGGQIGLPQHEYLTNCYGTAPDLPPDLPLAGRQYVGGLYNQSVILCGGYSYPAGAMSACYLWTPGDSKWIQGQNMSSGRDQAASAVVPSVGFVVTGGKDEKGTILNSMEVLDSDGWSAISGTPGPAYGHCAVTFQDSSLLVTGGIQDDFTFLDQALLITLETDHGHTSTVTTLPSMQHARAQHGCAAVDLSTGRVYVVAGGYGNIGVVLDTVEMFTFNNSPAEGSWEQLGNLPQQRHSLTVVFSLGQLIIAGGQSGGEVEEYGGEVLEYGWEEKSWVPWGECNTARYGHVTLVMDAVLGTQGWS